MSEVSGHRAIWGLFGSVVLASLAASACSGATTTTGDGSRAEDVGAGSQALSLVNLQLPPLPILPLPIVKLDLDLPSGDDAGAPSDDRGAGAFACDIDVNLAVNPIQIGPILERDRMYMAARPGFVRKQVPFLLDAQGLSLSTGGRYLFETRADADAYKDWITNGFVLDGTPFLQRAYWTNPVCHAFTVIGTADLADVPTHQTVLRTERFATPAGSQRAALDAQWPALLDAARQRGYTGVRLLYNRREALVELTYFADRTLGVLPGDPLALAFLLLAAPLGAPLADAGYARVFDRTEYSLTIWAPFVAGDQGAAAPFPNSPPLPGPGCGDGVCEPSRGETGASCAADCAARCGDAVCQADEGEATTSCPSDCRL